MPKPSFDRFKNLTYASFREMAQDESLSSYEKIGFPDSYREGYGAAIFADICAKLPHLALRNQVVVDIGPGCSDLPKSLIALCERQGHRLILIDAPEMLDQLPDAPFIEKIPAYYPKECPQLFTDYAGKVNVVLAYSVMQIIFAEGLLFPFIDQTLTLMAEGAQWLIGDIPNVSKRKRFFSSPKGVRFHQEFMQTTDTPIVNFNVPDEGQIDDALLFALLLRCRMAGFDSYLVPQPETLPMANRREDMIMIKP